MHGACDSTLLVPRGDELPALVDRGGLIVVLDGADASAAERIAGAGVVRLRRGDAIALRAGCDGVPTWIDGRIDILPSHVEGDVDGTLEGTGDLTLSGAVRAGATVRATGAVVVGGAVERATVAAGASLVIEGRAARAELRAGWTAGVAESLRQALAGVAPALVDIAASARLAGRDRGRRIQVIHRVVGLDHPGLGARLAQAEDAVGTVRSDWPMLFGSVADALVRARRGLAGAALIDDPVGEITRAAEVLAAAFQGERAPVPAVLRVARLDESVVDASGSLHVTESGVVESDLEVGGDLFVMAPRASVRGGVLAVGGRLRARRLTCDKRRPLRVELRASTGVREPLRAEQVDRGVEIRVLGERFTPTRRLREVTVVIERGRPLLLAEGVRVAG